MQAQASIFGFAEFLAAFALLVVLYTINEAMYRFRVAVSPIPLFKITFVVVVVVGFGTLTIDVWYAEHWPTLPGIVGQAGLQALLGMLFFLTSIAWLFFVLIRPASYGPLNAQKYLSAIYFAIYDGADPNLGVVALDFARSTRSIIEHSALVPLRFGPENMPPPPKPSPTSAIAHDILMLIGNQRFCRKVVAAAPGTAIQIFREMSRQEKYNIPVWEFARNVSTEAIRNTDSVLYHEEREFSRDLIAGYKSFSTALYGNFDLVEALAAQNASPLEVDLDLTWDMNGAQQRMYCKTVLRTLESYLSIPRIGLHSYALINAFRSLEWGSMSLYKLDGVGGDFYRTNEYDRLKAVVDFIDEAVKLLEKYDVKPLNKAKRAQSEYRQFDIYDEVVDLIIDVFCNASSVQSNFDACWVVQHNATFSEIFRKHTDGAAWAAIQKRVRRQIYFEIMQMDMFENFKSAKLLGWLLNVVGVELRERSNFNRDTWALQKVILRWISGRYLKIVSTHPDVAKSCLNAGISFDRRGKRLIKTYAKGTEPKPTQRYLKLH